MILNRDHGGFGAQRPVVAFDEHVIGELQRTGDHEQNFVRRAELDDRVLKKFVLAFVGAGGAIAVAVSISVAVVAMAAAELDGNPHRRGFRKEPRQAAYDVWFWSASSCLVGH
jgi:hypothetical protein